MIEICFDNGYFEELVDNTTRIISEYVKKDPTKFCSYEEFELGSSTLKEFCLIRSESIKAQLEGSIGTTKETQDSSTFINADEINISDMGSMENTGGMGNPGDMPGFGDMDGFEFDSQQNADGSYDEDDQAQQFPGDFSSPPSGMQPDMSQFPGFEGFEMPSQDQGNEGFMPGQMPEGDSNAEGGFKNAGNPSSDRPDSSVPPDTSVTEGAQAQDIIYTAICAAVLMAGIAFAALYKKTGSTRKQ